MTHKAVGLVVHRRRGETWELMEREMTTNKTEAKNGTEVFLNQRSKAQKICTAGKKETKGALTCHIQPSVRQQ